MYKKLLLTLSFLYLTGCSVAKPVILNASYKQLNQVKKAYTQTTVRNGANDLEIIKSEAGRYAYIAGEQRIDYYIDFYVTPYNNPQYFDYEDDENSTRQDGNYRSYNANLFFDVKASIRLYFRNLVSGATEESALFTNIMQRNTSQAAINTKVFKMYKLPYNTNQIPMTDGAFFNSYVYNNTLETYEAFNGIVINPLTYKFKALRNRVYGGYIYAFTDYEEDISNLLPPLEDPNANRLNLFYYNDFITLGALKINRFNELENYPKLNAYANELKTVCLNFFNCNNQTGNLSFQYNASISEELTTYENGYSQGIEEGTNGVGTTRVQQVFRAIQSFLNIDFGFFKLAHVLGGMLVIAIVIFVVRWFR